MWMTPHEIKNRYEPVDFLANITRYDNKEDLWQAKAEEATVGKAYNSRSPLRPGQEGQTLLQSIREKGIQTPVSVGKTWLHDGHHRVAAAEMVDKNYLVPVDHQ